VSLTLSVFLTLALFGCTHVFNWGLAAVVNAKRLLQVENARPRNSRK
jgi:hypothetical protein